MKLNEYTKFFLERPKDFKFGYWQIVIPTIIKEKNIFKILCKCTCCNETYKLVRCDHIINGVSAKCNYCKKKLPIYKGILTSVFNGIKYSAKIRKIEFNLTIEEIGDLFEKQKRKCAISGLDLILKRNLHDRKATASLDRKDSKKDYTLNNVQWIHKDINKMKMDFDSEYFFYICELINKNDNK